MPHLTLKPTTKLRSASRLQLAQVKPNNQPQTTDPAHSKKQPLTALNASKNASKSFLAEVPQSPPAQSLPDSVSLNAGSRSIPRSISRPLSKEQTALKPSPSNEAEHSPIATDLKATDLKATDLKDFPSYPGSAASPDSGAFTTTAPFEKVTAFFNQTLIAQNQRWKAQSISTGPDLQIYQIASGSTTRYLNIFSSPPIGTQYVLTEQPTTLTALKDTESANAQIGDILADLKGIEGVDASQTAEPVQFSRFSEIQNMNLIPGAQPEKALDQYLRTPLVQNGFQVEENPQPYGGGPLYALKRQTFVGYLNLVPSRDGKATVIVIWNKLPTTSS
jgi:hypothetical protein